MARNKYNEEFHKDFRKRGLRVDVKNNNVTKAWRKLKRLVQDEGLNQELRDRQHYEKPSAKRRKEKAKAKRRWEKKRKEIELNS